MELAKWADWSADQVARNAECWTEWSRGGGPEIEREDSTWISCFQGPRVPSYATAHGTPLPD